MESITRQDAATLGREVEEALRAVAERHGLTVSVRGGTYDAGFFKPRVEFKTDGSDKQEFERYATMYGLQATDFGRTFTSQGREFKVAGIAPRSTRRPILATETRTGRTFKFEANAVVRSLAPTIAVEAHPTPAETHGFALVVDGEVVKTSKSKASLQSYRSKTKCGGDIVTVS
jgi:hypothetical protein